MYIWLKEKVLLKGKFGSGPTEQVDCQKSLKRGCGHVIICFMIHTHEFVDLTLQKHNCLSPEIFKQNLLRCNDGDGRVQLSFTVY